MATARLCEIALDSAFNSKDQVTNSRGNENNYQYRADNNPKYQPHPTNLSPTNLVQFILAPSY